MSTMVHLNPYDKAVLDGILSDTRIPKTEANKVFKKYYPLVLNIYCKEVEPEKYSSMLRGIYLKGLNAEEVLKRTLGVRMIKMYSRTCDHNKKHIVSATNSVTHAKYSS
ncbi:hypothetical protein [Paenibacillus agricola]|uniref:Uncharacterized protein n=1 Tax=Paenibacillus agricola TaxID=2716264 RepID=A0ABX0JGG7_9BACL|nr:hypothetical protein [Paenibacillus agricola]NHN33339.1 hypothetical protein [Paenibacillus agricola]